MTYPRFFIDAASSNGEFFTDAACNDVIFGPRYSTQKILLGTASNDESVLRIASNDVYISANFIPTSCNLYNLGSPGYVWKDLYLGGQSIYLGDTKIQINESNQHVEIRKISDNSLKRLVVDEIQLGTGTVNTQQRIVNRNGQISFVNVNSNTGAEQTASEVRARTLIADSNAYLGSGSLALPSLAFKSFSNTGIYNPATNALGFVTNGVERMSIDATGAIALKGAVTLTDNIACSNVRIGNGTAALPSLSFSADTDTGLYRPNTNTLGLVTNGLERVTIDSNGDVTLSGKLTVLGGTTSLNIQSVVVEDNMISLNKNLTGTPPSSLLSGIEVRRGNLDKYYFVFQESTDLFKVGLCNNLQAVATRKDTITANTIPYWNDSTKLYDFTNTITMTPATGTINATTFTGAGNLTNITGFGVGTNYMGAGTGHDNATLTQYNMAIRSWWGIGFPSYDNINRIVFDTRTGNITSSGTITAPTFSGNATSATSATNATNATNSANVAITDFSTSGTNYLVFTGGTSGNQPLRIRSSQLTCNPNTGNVGIGTAANATYKLHVQGRIYASEDITAFSDERKKTDLQVIDHPLERISKLTGYTFARSDKLDHPNPDRRFTGLLAQDVLKTLPEAVYAGPEENVGDGPSDSNALLSVAYGNMMGLIVEGIKEIVARLEKLEQAVKN